jgi:hypothetical protein
MTRRAWRRAMLVPPILACAPAATSAHVFVQPYTLPVPFWMYLYGCAASLVLSFAVVAYLLGRPTVARSYRTRDLLPGTRRAQSAWNGLLSIGRAGALVCLLLTMATGLVGSSDPRVNINYTLFWIAFLLGLTYATAFIGDVYALVNPWRTIADLVGALGLDLSKARLPYPAWLGYLPAFASYVGLIWMELFTLPRPYVLSLTALGYTAATLGGAFLFGTQKWFAQGELFGVFFRLVGLMAPVEYGRTDAGRAFVRLRPPFVAACFQPRMHASLVLFVLFMLSSTTYDAIHQTYLWVSLYWQRLLPLASPLWGSDMVAAQAGLTRWYRVYQYAGLVLSPFIYLILYVLVLACARAVVRSRVSVSALAGQFASTLVPIALVYHATHYSTILIVDLPRLPGLAADPLGLGWLLFPAPSPPRPGPLNMGIIWHTQVALMLGGHVVGVYLAHLTALRVFGSARQGLVSQVPLLALMVAYTSLGLWVLSLPLDVPQVLPIE